MELLVSNHVDNESTLDVASSVDVQPQMVSIVSKHLVQFSQHNPVSFCIHSNCFVKVQMHSSDTNLMLTFIF